jgi:hypothetical protein
VPAALAIAASKRNSLRAAFWSGVATAGGILSVAVTSETASVVAQSPRLATAFALSVLMASFGQDISVRQVLTVPISPHVRIRALP